MFAYLIYYSGSPREWVCLKFNHYFKVIIATVFIERRWRNILFEKMRKRNKRRFSVLPFKKKTASIRTFRLCIIMVALTCMFPLNISAFDTYAKEIAERFVELYPWYQMPVGVHKILIYVYGAKIDMVMPLPPGYMSEEAAEASNKVYREIRQHHTRKDTHEHTSTDLFHFMSAYSDPLISSGQIKPRLKIPIPEKTKSLLLRWN